MFRVRYLIAAGGAALLAAALAPLAHAAPEPAPKPAAKYDWPQFALDAGKSANDTAESTVTLANVKNLKQLFKVALPDAPDGSPVYLHDVTTPMGVKDVVYVQGEHGHLMAFDGHSGAKIWSDSFGPGGISNSSPAVEPSRKFIYINANDAKVHKVQVGDGKEVKTGGWPVSTGGGKSSSALTIATARNGHTYLYASNQGHGRVTTIDLADASRHVFDLACSNLPDTETPSCSTRGANPWARGPAFDASLDRFFQMGGTNNGPSFVPGQIWRNSIVAIPADGHTTMKGGKGYPADSYTPSNVSALIRSDRDIGSGGVLILPTTLSKKFPHLGVQPGKDRAIRLINLANMSGKGAPGNTGGELQLFPFPAMSMMRAQGAVWTNPADQGVWVFVPGEKGIAGFQVTVDAAGNPKLVLKWTIFNGWTSSAFVANGVLFAANGAGEHTQSLNLHQVQAINPTTGKVLWTGKIGLHHWSSPIMANGIVYMVDGNSGGFGSGTSGNLIAWALG